MNMMELKIHRLPFRLFSSHLLMFHVLWMKNYAMLQIDLSFTDFKWVKCLYDVYVWIIIIFSITHNYVRSSTVVNWVIKCISVDRNWQYIHMATVTLRSDRYFIYLTSVICICSVCRLCVYMVYNLWVIIS